MNLALKPALSTVLSVAGVLAAGAAAFAVNSSVLGGASTPTSDMATTTIVAAPQGAQVAAQDTSGQSPTAGNGARAEANAVTDTTTTYQVGDAGSVVIDIASGAIQVVSIMPAAGWAAEPATIFPDGSVKVHFYGAAARLEFVASMSSGKIVVNVTTEPVNQPAPDRTGRGGDQRMDDDDEGEHRENHEGREEHDEDEDDD